MKVNLKTFPYENYQAMVRWKENFEAELLKIKGDIEIGEWPLCDCKTLIKEILGE